jgi:hypothetical protein
MFCKPNSAANWLKAIGVSTTGLINATTSVLNFLLSGSTAPYPALLALVPQQQQQYQQQQVWSHPEDGMLPQDNWSQDMLPEGSYLAGCILGEGETGYYGW